MNKKMTLQEPIIRIKSSRGKNESLRLHAMLRRGRPAAGGGSGMERGRGASKYIYIAETPAWTKHLGRGLNILLLFLFPRGWDVGPAVTAKFRRDVFFRERIWPTSNCTVEFGCWALGREEVGGLFCYWFKEESNQ